MSDSLRDEVEAALRRIRDPTLDMNVFDAGLVKDIQIQDGAVTIEADLSDFAAEGEEQVMAALMDAATSVEEVERAHVEHALPDTDGNASGLGDIDRIVAVASAKGGVGKTTVAVNLACALAANQKVGLFDADIHGPNVPALLGVSGPVYSDDDGHPMPVDLEGLAVMSVGLMEEGAPLAWRGAMAHDALTELFEDTAWGDRATLVIDLPPGTGDVVLTTLQEVAVDGVVFVTTPFHAAVTDTERSVELFRENDVPVLGVVANMGRFTCPACGDEHDLFPHGSPLDEVDVPLLAELPFMAEMQERPAPGGVSETIENLADRVSERFEEIWNVPVPEEALDLRGIPADERYDLVKEAFDRVASGGEFVLMSDRDPSPVSEYLAELAGYDDPSDAFESFRVRQHNPETWILEAVVRSRGERADETPSKP